ncbi:MAG: fluoride efflux transporter CrcB [Burkholderiaceae bacterium]|nr:fluoride efflux transporter CrcB [Burkholderiaceae bacterium]MCD8516377.1 fluoride efflux transporter CrcB [Burkholderiaceae bacterium]MCD8538225.1 fluoride efflux transporter CrcB [Burkholderiaceae bacterium]MCD8565763.1 fluoride efflux transporter CrcB [Burkholderiaceae bacterium]
MASSPWTLANFLAIGAGAAIGAWTRWALGLLLNPGPDRFPLGTWVANLSGSYIIGLTLAYSLFHPDWPAHIRLFLVTGLLGALTTFSTFSAETFTFFEQGRWSLGLSYALISLLGCLAMTALGWWTVQALRG